MKHFGKLLAVAALAMVSYTANAELEPQWSKGTMIANVNMGVAPFGMSTSFDYVLVDEWWQGHFTVGGEFDFRAQDHYTAFGVSPRATYGLNITPEFEVHVAAAVGFGTWNYKYEYEYFGVKYKTTGNDTFIMHNEFAGCRYFFNENFGVMAEAGYSNWFPELRAGISLKF